MYVSGVNITLTACLNSVMLCDAPKKFIAFMLKECRTSENIVLTLRLELPVLLLKVWASVS